MPDISNKGNRVPPPSNPMGESEDSDSAALSRSESEFLTREEVLRRRSRWLRRLARIYMDHYWSMIEELKLKHGEYYWRYGKPPFLDDTVVNNKVRDNCENNQTGGDYINNNSETTNRCKANGCKTKAMALTRFCHSHILSDPKQVLYKGCTYVIKSSPMGSVLCMKPILRSSVPLLCPGHLRKAEKTMRISLKKGTKVAPKFSVLVAESIPIQKESGTKGPS